MKVSSIICLVGIFLPCLVMDRESVGQSTLDLKAPAATVNGEPVTIGQFYARLETMRFSDFLANINPIVAKTETSGQLALNSLIAGRLVLQYAKKIGVMPTEAEVNAEFESTKSGPDISQAIQTKKFTVEQIKEDLALQKAFFNVATLNITLSQEEIKAYYDRHLELHGRPDEWTVSGIRVTGMAAAEAVKKSLAGGMEFGAAAAQYSEDPTTKSKNGELGVVRSLDQNVPPFLKQALSAMKVGEVSQPLAVPGAPSPEKQVYLILKLTKKVDGENLSLEKVRDKVEHAALLEKSGAGFKKIAELRKEANIVILLPQYSELANKP